jgi:uncharacterized damage-inducible protein DinB
MIRAAICEARVFQSWLDYQDALKRAIAPLSAEQLQRRPLDGRRTPGEVAEHIVFGRALHLGRALGEEATGLTPFQSWDTAADPPRSAGDIVRGLELTWQVIVRCVMRGAPTEEIPVGEEQSSTQVVWGLLDHDLPHAGQLSLLLRADGLPGVEI